MSMIIDSMYEPGDPITERLLQVFPDAVEFKLVMQNRSVEYFPSPETSESVELEKEDIPLEVVFDGVWAGMSRKTHTVFYYIEP